jgi:hypothetical protein
MDAAAQQVQPRKARNGQAHGFSMDTATLARLQHLQAFTVEHFGVQHSQSSLVRRAIAFLGAHLDSITTGLRSVPAKAAKAKDALEAEAYFIRVASTGAIVPFVELPQGSAVLTWKELLNKYGDKRTVIEKLLAEQRS